MKHLQDPEDFAARVRSILEPIEPPMVRNRAWFDSNQGVGELVRVLDDIERRRTLLDESGRELRDILNCDPEAHTLWVRFTASGGVTSEDLRLFLEGQSLKKDVRQRRHLRLVSCRKASLPRPRL